MEWSRELSVLFCVGKKKIINQTKKLLFSHVISYEEERSTSTSVIKTHLIRGLCCHNNTEGSKSILWQPPPHNTLAEPQAILHHPKGVWASPAFPYPLHGQTGPSGFMSLCPEQHQEKETSEWEGRTAWHFMCVTCMHWFPFEHVFCVSCFPFVFQNG